MTDQQPIPVFRISLTNATMLSVLYLVIAVVVEVVRRTSNARWAEQLSLALESFPARTLDLLGVLDPLRRAWVENHVPNLAVRLLYGATAVGIIFALGLAVGSAMWGISKLARR
jgi:hypothetical protein